MTMSSPPDTTETLTEEERRYLGHGFDLTEDERVVAKLLRLYDAQKERIALLEQYCKAQAEANETLAQCVRERESEIEYARGCALERSERE